MAKTDGARWRVEPGTKVHLDKIDTRSTDGAPGDKAATEESLDAIQADLQGLQERLYAEGKQSLLVAKRRHVLVRSQEYGLYEVRDVGRVVDSLRHERRQPCVHVVPELLRDSGRGSLCRTGSWA